MRRLLARSRSRAAGRGGADRRARARRAGDATIGRTRSPTWSSPSTAAPASTAARRRSATPATSRSSERCVRSATWCWSAPARSPPNTMAGWSATTRCRRRASAGGLAPFSRCCARSPAAAASRPRSRCWPIPDARMVDLLRRRGRPRRRRRVGQVVTATPTSSPSRRRCDDLRARHEARAGALRGWADRAGAADRQTARSTSCS